MSVIESRVTDTYHATKYELKEADNASTFLRDETDREKASIQIQLATAYALHELAVSFSALAEAIGRSEKES